MYPQLKFDYVTIITNLCTLITLETFFLTRKLRHMVIGAHYSVIENKHKLSFFSHYTLTATYSCGVHGLQMEDALVLLKGL